MAITVHLFYIQGREDFLTNVFRLVIGLNSYIHHVRNSRHYKTIVASASISSGFRLFSFQGRLVRRLIQTRRQYL